MQLFLSEFWINILFFVPQENGEAVLLAKAGIQILLSSGYQTAHLSNKIQTDFEKNGFWYDDNLTGLSKTKVISAPSQGQPLLYLNGE
jgi:hypothetical protein